jgi:flagellar biosynthesis/type III secretory pathway protein FliH
VPDPKIEQLEVRLAELRDEAEAQEKLVADLKKEIAISFRNGEKLGREAALQDVQDDRAEALVELQEGIHKALARFETNLKATERLAALLAQHSLDRLFGEAPDRRDLVCGLIRHQCQAIQKEAIVRVEVAAADFDSEDLAAVASAASLKAADIVVSSKLQAGDCNIKLQLGTLEIGLNQQWGTLRAELDRMMEGGAAS